MANKKQPGLFPGCSADQWIQPVDDAAILFEAGKDGFASINGDAVMLGTALIDGGVQSVAADKVPLISDLLADPSIGMHLKETNKAVRLYTSNGTSKARAFYDMRSDTCVVCPTKDLASLISRTTLYPPVYAFMYRFAGPFGNATLGAEVDSVFGIKAARSRFALNQRLSKKLQNKWLDYATDYPIDGFEGEWPVYTSDGSDTDGTYMWFGKKGASGAAASPDYMGTVRDMVARGDEKCMFWKTVQKAHNEDCKRPGSGPECGYYSTGGIMTAVCNKTNNVF
jgi:hypothetical protein|eukprot:SAG25_NODE_91_length_16078_cov_7.663058_6_plen_282_part_00